MNALRASCAADRGRRMKMETAGREGFLEITKKAFSLSEDKAENGVIRDRLLSGEK